MLKSYDDQLQSVFGVNTFQTISKIPNIFRVNFSSNTVEEITKEVIDLIKKLFEDDDFLVRVIFWYKDEKDKYLSNSIFITDKKDYSVGIFKFKISDLKFEEFIREHLNYERGGEPSINVTAFIFDVEKKVLLNIYDDRGADYLVV